MIKKQIQEALNTQINAELSSAYLYLSMSLDAENKGFGGVANWMFVQWKEEQDHARILQLYMISQSAPVMLHPIEEVKTNWCCLLDMFNDALKYEQKVTQMIHRLSLLAMQEQDLATLNRLMWFVNEQTEEEQNVSSIISRLELVGDDGTGMHLIDQCLAERKYCPADAL